MLPPISKEKMAYFEEKLKDGDAKVREGFGLLEKRSGSSHMQSEEEIHTPFQYIKQSKPNPQETEG